MLFRSMKTVFIFLISWLACTCASDAHMHKGTAPTRFCSFIPSTDYNIASASSHDAFPGLTAIDAEDTDFNDSDDELKSPSSFVGSEIYHGFFLHLLFLKNLFVTQVTHCATPSILHFTSALKL